MTETLVEAEIESPPDQWPPVAHIIHKKDMPAKEGTIALCGKKLMGIDLGNLRNANCPICKNCIEEF